MKERKRRHDDAHFPLQGKGKKAVKKISAPIIDPCPDCGKFSAKIIHLCDESLLKEAKK